MRTLGTLVVIGLIAADSLSAQAPEPTMKLSGPPKIWTADGWRPVSGNSDFLEGGGSSRPPAGPSQRQLAAEAARQRRERAAAFNNAGIAAWNRGEWGVATEQFRQAYAQNPDSKIIFNNFIDSTLKEGLVAMEQGDWIAAEQDFASLVLHRRDSAQYQQLLSQARDRVAGLKDADALNEKGRSAADQGDYVSAENDFKAASLLAPLNPAYRRNLGTVRTWRGEDAAQRGDFAEAVALFGSALEADSSNGPARSGQLLARQSLANAQTAQTAVQAKREAAAPLQQGLTQVAEGMKKNVPPPGLDLDGFASETGAFGSPTVRGPTVAVAPGTVGSNTRAGDQLRSGAALAATGQDLTTLYDVGGAPAAGSLPAIKTSGGPEAAVLATYPEKARNDPAMIELARQMAGIQVRQAALGKELDQLVQRRNQANDAAVVARLSTEVMEKQAAVQAAVQEAFEQKSKLDARHRLIDTTIEDGPVATSEPVPPSASTATAPGGK
jgi:tetratricopeptide (TPR) repeat protein